MISYAITALVNSVVIKTLVFYVSGENLVYKTIVHTFLIDLSDPSAYFTSSR